MKALEDIRVIDLSQNSPGPLATMMLSDFGAEVIHIARPGVDSLLGLYAGDIAGDSFIRMRYQAEDAMMRNKRSIALNLKSDRGRAILLELVAGADVLVEEMRPGKMAKLGLDYASLAEHNPRLVYCSITGFGQNGPLANDAGHDLNYLAMAGVLDLFRGDDGAPVPPQNLLSDCGGGAMSAVNGIMMALYARERSGLGQQVDVSMTDAVMYLAVDQYSTALGAGMPSADWRGGMQGEYPHYRSYRCADDRWISVGALEKAFAQNLFDLLELPDLLEQLDDRAAWAEMIEQIAARFATAPRDDWIDRAAGRDIALAPILSPEEAAVHPQTRARDMICEAESTLR